MICNFIKKTFNFELKDRNIKLLAEFDNYQKRTLLEKERASRFDGINIVKDLLPVFDDIDRMIDFNKEENNESILEAICMIDSKIHNILSKYSIKKMLKNKKRPSSIINMSSQLGHVGMGGRNVYNMTKFGIHVRAIGGNREAARLAGVPVNFIEVMVYCFMGLIVALGGLIMIARIDSTQATIATSMEIHVIAAVIIGGTSLFGGRGSIYGSFMGAILLSMMTNALVIAGVDYFWQLFIMGIIVLIAVAINNFREGKVSISSFFQNKNLP